MNLYKWKCKQKKKKRKKKRKYFKIIYFYIIRKNTCLPTLDRQEEKKKKRKKKMMKQLLQKNKKIPGFQSRSGSQENIFQRIIKLYFIVFRNNFSNLEMKERKQEKILTWIQKVVLTFGLQLGILHFQAKKKFFNHFHCCEETE